MEKVKEPGVLTHIDTVRQSAQCRVLAAWHVGDAALSAAAAAAAAAAELSAAATTHTLARAQRQRYSEREIVWQRLNCFHTAQM